MKKLLLLTVAYMATGAIAQSTKPTNVYPSNLESNMYFDKYDETTSSIVGMHFLVLSNGDNSKDKTPAFEVSIYLMPEGKSSREDLIIAKVYKLDGIYHMGTHEFKNETISLAGKGIEPGTYRVGIWVNSNNAFTEDTNDNAMLFQTPIKITKAPATSAPIKAAPKKVETEEEVEEDDGWDW
ncbi:MAG: hypothetical protein ACK4K0_07115 [Flavobacteriales bacterium]